MKKVIFIILIVLLLIIMILFMKKYNSTEIEFGYENTGATSVDADIHYQILPQWNYKILKDGSLYYRETDGIITRNKNEYQKAIKEFDKSYKFIKKIDQTNLNKIIEYIIEQQENKQSTNGANHFNKYYTTLKQGFNDYSLSGEIYVNYIKNLIQE